MALLVARPTKPSQSIQVKGSKIIPDLKGVKKVRSAIKCVFLVCLVIIIIIIIIIIIMSF